MSLCSNWKIDIVQNAKGSSRDNYHYYTHAEKEISREINSYLQEVCLCSLGQGFPWRTTVPLGCGWSPVFSSGHP
jgi:hypothetical protein